MICDSSLKRLKSGDTVASVIRSVDLSGYTQIANLALALERRGPN